MMNTQTIKKNKDQEETPDIIHDPAKIVKAENPNADVEKTHLSFEERKKNMIKRYQHEENTFRRMLKQARIEGKPKGRIKYLEQQVKKANENKERQLRILQEGGRN